MRKPGEYICTGRTRPASDDEHIEVEMETLDGRVVWGRMALESLRGYTLRVRLPDATE